MLYTPPGFYTHLPISQHVLDVAKISGREVVLKLLLCQPFKIGESKQVLLEICLPGHYARFHKEGLLPLYFNPFVETWVDDVVTGRDVSHDPGVHINASGLNQDSFCGLQSRIS